MTPTERADRLAQLKQELQKAQQAQSLYQGQASEAYALAAEQVREQTRHAYTAYGVRCKAQALSWGRRCGELMCEIAAIEGWPAALAAPVALSAEQCAAVDDTMGAAA
jgi:predicted YcjX-like family ATPase